MARKKVSKMKVKKPLGKVKRQTLSPSDIMEKDFRDIPSKLPSQLRKDMAALKKNVVKQQSSLLKLQKKQKIVENKHIALSTKIKGKSTPTAKKQWVAVNKARNILEKAVEGLFAQLDHSKKAIKALSSKQAKFSALNKEIAKFDKEWETKLAEPQSPVIKSKKIKIQKIRPLPMQEKVNNPSEAPIELTSELVEFDS